eukprot:520795-Pleurochrysis_carterae.AAC.1
MGDSTNCVRKKYMDQAPPNGDACGRVRARARDMANTVRLREGDVVSVAISTLGQQYARSRGAVPWTSASVRDEGTVLGKKNGKWGVMFDDLDPAVLLRKAIHFVSRPSQAGAGHEARRGEARNNPRTENDDSGDESERADYEDSSSKSSDDGAAAAAVPALVGAAEHDGGRAD